MAYTATLLEAVGLSDGSSLRVYDISPDAATGSLTVTGYDSVTPIGVVALNEDPTATTDNAIVQALQNTSTTNQVDIKLWASSYVAATTFKDFQITVLCQNP